MHILFYHKKDKCQPVSVTDRASARAALLKRTIWWDIGMLLLLAGPGMLLYWYAPVLCRMPAIAWLVPVSQSPWEQCKPMFWTICLTAFTRRICMGHLQKGVLTTYAYALLQALICFIAAFYTVTGIWGQAIPMLALFLCWLNTLGALVYLRQTINHQRHSSLPGMMLLLAEALCFVLFTYYPPAIGLFTK